MNLSKPLIFQIRVILFLATDFFSSNAAAANSFKSSISDLFPDFPFFGQQLKIFFSIKMKEKKKSKKWLIPQMAQHWTAIPRVPSSYLVGFRALFFKNEAKHVGLLRRSAY